MKRGRLTIWDHGRDVAGMTYVYPVISRRAGGVSVGINLNTNNACNWRCVYCQVPDLQRGMAPAVDLDLLRAELSGFLGSIADGSFHEHMDIPAEYCRIRDIALSGNGEATSAAEFAAAVDLLGEERALAGLADDVKIVLITNGSLMHRPAVRAGLTRLNQLNGEIWFKMDTAATDEIRRLNGAAWSPERAIGNLKSAASLCDTWIQTCMFALDGKPAADSKAYLNFINRVIHEQIQVQGVLLYSLARPSMQKEAGRLSALPGEWLEELAKDIRALGLPVRVTV